MSTLNTDTNLADHDGIYQHLVELHEGLTDEDAFRVSAKLILILINHIGDREIIDKAIALARNSGMKGDL